MFTISYFVFRFHKILLNPILHLKLKNLPGNLSIVYTI